ncbi:hypothetical protein [Blastococcus capsensis]|nr:hypothetical protein [Blastococcus capsensis]MDK3256697.1 hypothetical protein [Blastococcus capsensis]
MTPAQVNAAKLKVKRSAVSGKMVDSSVYRIANAKRAAGHGASALTQRPQ